MAYEVVMPYHLHMPSYFLETFTEYPCYKSIKQKRLPLPGHRFKIQMSVQPSMTAQGKSVILYF